MRAASAVQAPVCSSCAVDAEREIGARAWGLQLRTLVGVEEAPPQCAVCEAPARMAVAPTVVERLKRWRGARQAQPSLFGGGT